MRKGATFEAVAVIALILSLVYLGGRAITGKIADSLNASAQMIEHPEQINR